MKKKLIYSFNLFFVIAGVLLVYFLGAKFGWQEIWVRITNINILDLSIILALPLVWIFFHSLGWHLLLDNKKKFSFWQILGAQISASAVSEMPMGQAGGEPYRIYYLRKHYGKEESPNIIASVILYNTIHSLVTGLLFVGGFIGILLITKVKIFKIIIFLSALFIGAVFVLFFIQKQKKGIMEKIFNLLEKIKFLRKFAQKKREKAILVDQRLIKFYLNHKITFYFSLFFILIAKSMGAIEFYLIMKFVGFPVDFLIAFVVFAGTAVVQLILFFFPIGPAEGAIVFLFNALKQDPGSATALAVIRRVRVIFWTFIGLLIGHFWGPKLGEKHSEKQKDE